MIDFAGKTLVLTGAGGGIGRAVAQLFRHYGASLVLTDVSEADLTALQESLGRAEDIATMAQDVADSAMAEAAAKLCRERFGGCDYLVNCAGLYRDKLVATMSDAQWHETISINLDGTFYNCRAFAPLLRDGGAVVNIASLAGHRGSIRHAHYAAAKAAVMGLTKSLAWELAPKIRANIVSPGIIETPMVKGLMDSKGRQILEQTPLGRIGAPTEVAGAVAFLCSDLASFVTGETLHVNGGLHISG